MAPLAGYVLFLAKFVDGTTPNTTWSLFLFAWTIAAAIVAWRLARPETGILEWLDGHAAAVAAGVVVVFAAGLIVVNVWQARNFSMSIYAEDTAYYSQVLWNTLHGHILSGNVQQERLYNPPVSTDLALHVSPVPLVLLLPAYALFPHFLTLLIVRDLVLAAAAWPLFLLARERMGGVGGVAAVALYLGNPAVIGQGFESFTLLHLAPFPFFWAFRAFVRQEPGAFLGWTAVALGVREDVAIAMAGFGIWALVARRGFRWLALGLGIPVVWWAVVTLAIQPAFGRWGNSVFDVALAGGTRNPLGLYQSLLTDPSWIVDTLRAGGAKLVYGLLRAVGLVAVLGPEGLVAFPTLASTLFATRAFFGAEDPLSRFALLPSCALVGAAVVIVSRLGRRHRIDTRVFALAMLVLLPSVSLLDGAKDALRTRLLGYMKGHDAPALRQALGHIPGDAPVAAPIDTLPALSNRPRLFTLQYLDAYPAPRVEYFLIDRRPDRVSRNPHGRERYVALVGELMRSPSYETVWQRGDYLVLRRRGGAAT
jgi:hypothetical protein